MARSEEVADYIYTVSVELSRMARQSDLNVLSYLLDMSALEAVSKAGSPEAKARSKQPPTL